MAKSRTAAANATPVSVRSGKTVIKNIRVFQRVGAAARYFLQIFNTDTATVGTTTPEMVVPVPAGNANMEATIVDLPCIGKRGGIYLDTGLSYAVTTTHDGNTNPTSGQEPEVQIDYEPLG